VAVIELINIRISIVTSRDIPLVLSVAQYFDEVVGAEIHAPGSMHASKLFPSYLESAVQDMGETEEYRSNYLPGNWLAALQCRHGCNMSPSHKLALRT